MEECERAFQDLKRFLIEPAVLSKPIDRKPLYIYLSITEKAKLGTGKGRRKTAEASVLHQQSATRSQD